MLQVIYVFLLGLLLATFVHVAISTMYRAPEHPEAYDVDPTLSTEESVAVQVKRRAELKEHEKATSKYYTNFAIVTMCFVIVQLTVGLCFATKLGPLADGLLLGGIFSLTCSVAFCFRDREGAGKLLIVFAALVIALALGYVKFLPH